MDPRRKAFIMSSKVEDLIVCLSVFIYLLKSIKYKIRVYLHIVTLFFKFNKKMLELFILFCITLAVHLVKKHFSL